MPALGRPGSLLGWEPSHDWALPRPVGGSGRFTTAASSPAPGLGQSLCKISGNGSIKLDLPAVRLDHILEESRREAKDYSGGAEHEPQPRPTSCPHTPPPEVGLADGVA